MHFFRLIINLTILLGCSQAVAERMYQLNKSSVVPAGDDIVFDQYPAIRLAANGPVADPTTSSPATAKPNHRPKSRCAVRPPKGYSEIKSVEYACNDLIGRIEAQAAIDLKVDQIYQQRSKASKVKAVTVTKHKPPQAIQKQQQAEHNRLQAETARLGEQARRKEQQALATSAEVQAELSSDITKKMIAVCAKTWAKGEHRCYCEKYIEFAPANIKSNTACE